jgi:hypothetical protein
MNLYLPSRPALFVVAAALVFGVAGCTTPADSGAPSTASEAPMPTDAPSTEPSGPETPRTGGGDDGVAISIAQLPIGGTADDPGGENQCVTVSWLQSDLAPGNGVRVTELQVTPPGAFSVGGSCGGVRACASYTFGSGSCSVAVRARGTNGSAQLKFKGEITCARGKQSSCQEFRSRVDPGKVDLRQPDGPDESETSEPPETSETSPTG